MSAKAKPMAVWAVAALCLILAACSSGRDDGGASAEEVRVAYVADSAGVEDEGFNQLGAQGLARAGEELGVETRIVASGSEAGYAADVRALAEDGYDLIIGAGFNLIDAVAEASQEFPETDFAITDIPVAEVPGAGENLRGLPFDQEPAGLLAGYLAGLMVLESERAGGSEAERAGGGDGVPATVGAIGGQRIPPVVSWIRGFEAGLAEASPSTELITGYSGSFVDPERCSRIARSQIAAGVDLIFEAAARCGIDAIKVAGQQDVLAIGTDGHYLELGDHVLASGLKRTDIAVYETVEDYLNGDFQGGEDRLFTIADGGVGLSELGEAVPSDVIDKVEQRAAELAAEDL